jgi:hypothetical protein
MKCGDTVVRAMVRAMMLLLAISGPVGAVIPVAADGLITPAHYCDLQGKTLRFTPSRKGYLVAMSKAVALGDLGTKLERPDYPSIRSLGWRVPLPFEFPYAGVGQHELFVNSAGNLTFERPEAQIYSERDTWPAGTVQSVAGSLNDRASAGQERMICPLWGLYSSDTSKTRIFVRRAADEFVVTWQVERYVWFGESYRPLGPNVFQARLFPGGGIEFTYQQVSEKDGIVGLFYGEAEGVEFATLKPAVPVSDAAPDSRLQIRSVAAALSGRALRFTFQMAGPVVRSVPEGTLWYRVFLKRGLNNCEIGLEAGRWSRPYLSRECTGVPGVRIVGNCLELFLSTFEAESSLGAGTRWYADVRWARGRGADLEVNTGEEAFRMPASGLQPHLSAGYHEGNIFEIYRYPHVSKSVFPHLRYLYHRFAPRDDMAVVLTDFRIDDLHNHQGSIGAGYNVAIQGIGSRPATLHGRADAMGSEKLQVATGPIYLGPRFAEFLEDGDRHYRNYANAVGWMAHELTHRWGMDLQFRNPEDGRVESLTAGDGHWNSFLNTPSTVSVWRMFSDKPYSEKSQMEGFVYEELPNGNFRRAPNPWNLPTGFSALDLYAMGLIGAEEVPDTFLIAHPQSMGPNLFRGRKVMVRIQDVIAADGQRRPDAGESQKEFTIGIYLLHPGNRAVYADKFREAEGIEKMLIEYIRVATSGRMRLVAARDRK